MAGAVVLASISIPVDFRWGGAAAGMQQKREQSTDSFMKPPPQSKGWCSTSFMQKQEVSRNFVYFVLSRFQDYTPISEHNIDDDKSMEHILVILI